MEFLTEFPEMGRRDLSQLRQGIDEGFKTFSRAYGEQLEAFFSPLLKFMVWFEKLLIAAPWPIIILVIGAFAWAGSRSWKVTAGGAILSASQFICVLLCYSQSLWHRNCSYNAASGVPDSGCQL